MTEERQYFESLCQQIQQKDHSIRFVGIADKHGNLAATAYRERLIPLMDKEETEKYALQTVIRASMRETFAAKIGEMQYAIGIYRNLIRATIPIANGETNNSGKFYVLISFDRKTQEVNAIIENKVLPFLAENREYFL
jgi:hypothetical protein